MFSNLYQLDLRNKACVALANLRWIINENHIENWSALDLVIIMGSACLSIPNLNM